jgi:penicillin amidase
MPAPGWTGEHDWASFVPFDELPRVYNPASGIIVNANGRLVPDDYRHFITRDWAAPYRQRRINQLLREVERHPVYGDRHPGRISRPTRPRFCRCRRTQSRNRAPPECDGDEMGRWNRFMLAGRPEPLIHTAWLTFLQRGLACRQGGRELYGDLARPACRCWCSPSARPAGMVR